MMVPFLCSSRLAAKRALDIEHRVILRLFSSTLISNMQKGFSMKGPLIFTFLCAFSLPSYAETWAAQAHFGEFIGPVVHAPAKLGAIEKALKACGRVTKKCLNTVPASATVGGDSAIFVHTCCYFGNGGNACQILVGGDGNAGRQSAYDRTVRNMGEAGYQTTSCKIKGVYGLETGKRLPNWVD